MHAAHVAMSLFMGICGLGFVLSLLGIAPGLIGISVFLGYFATLGALTVAVVLLVMLAGRTSQGQVRPFKKHSWLGLMNGAIAMIFWIWLILHAR